MNKLIKESLDKIIEDEELVTIDNSVTGRVILYRCSHANCNSYKRVNGEYELIHEALDNVFMTSRDVYEISSGYCDYHASLVEAQLREFKRQRKKGL